MAANNFLEKGFTDTVQTLFNDSISVIKNNRKSFLILLGTTALLNLFYLSLSKNFINITDPIKILIGVLSIVAETLLAVFVTRLALLSPHDINKEILNKLPDFIVVWRYFLVNLILLVGIGIGLVLLIVPGIYVLIRYFLSPFFVIDKNAGLMESFRKSSETTNGIKLKLLPILVLALIPMFLSTMTSGDFLVNVLMGSIYDGIGIFILVVGGQLYKHLT